MSFFDDDDARRRARSFPLSSPAVPKAKVPPPNPPQPKPLLPKPPVPKPSFDGAAASEALEKGARRLDWLGRSLKRQEERVNRASTGASGARPGSSSALLDEAEVKRLEKDRKALAEEADKLRAERNSLLEKAGLSGGQQKEAEGLLAKTGALNRSQAIKARLDPARAQVSFAREQEKPLAELPLSDANRLLGELGETAKDEAELERSLASWSKSRGEAAKQIPLPKQKPEPEPQPGTQPQSETSEPSPLSQSETELKPKRKPKPKPSLWRFRKRPPQGKTPQDFAPPETISRQEPPQDSDGDNARDFAMGNAARQADEQTIENGEQALGEGARADARQLREAEAALERSRGAQRDLLREIARDLDRDPGARGERQVRAFQEIQAADSYKARQAPLTDPRNFEGIERMLEGQQKEGSDASGKFDEFLDKQKWLSDQRDEAEESIEKIATLEDQITGLQSSLTGVTSPAERQRIEGQLAALKKTWPRRSR
jgi:hypothetical protein